MAIVLVMVMVFIVLGHRAEIVLVGESRGGGHELGASQYIGKVAGSLGGLLRIVGV